MQLNPKHSFGDKEPYAEISQKSPMRWRVCEVVDGVATPQHYWWRCKDFLNDSVFYLNTGREFPMYGYTNKLKLNTEGGYLQIKNQGSWFEDNMKIMNAFLKEQDLPEITVVNDQFILIPTFYWQSTFDISFITSLIRSCSYKKAASIKELVDNEWTFADGYFNKCMELFKAITPEERKKKTVWAAQYSLESHKPDKINSGVIHNCGLQSWTTTWEES